jgi:hypothetical protein
MPWLYITIIYVIVNVAGLPIASTPRLGFLRRVSPKGVIGASNLGAAIDDR